MKTGLCLQNISRMWLYRRYVLLTSWLKAHIRALSYSPLGYYSSSLSILSFSLSLSSQHDLGGTESLVHVWQYSRLTPGYTGRILYNARKWIWASCMQDKCLHLNIIFLAPRMIYFNMNEMGERGFKRPECMLCIYEPQVSSPIP